MSSRGVQRRGEDHTVETNGLPVAHTRNVVACARKPIIVNCAVEDSLHNASKTRAFARARARVTTKPNVHLAPTSPPLATQLET